MGRDPSIDRQAVREVLEQHPVRLGVLFGSQVRGTSGDHSDVDVAVEFDPSLSDERCYRAKLSLVVSLAKALGTDDIDVADFGDVEPDVGASALEHGVVLVGELERAEQLREQFESQLSTTTHEQRMRRFDELLTRMEERV